MVVAVEVLEHVPDEAEGAFLRTVCGRTRPGGRAVICVPTTNIPAGGKHFRHYDLQSFSEAVARSGANLKIARTEYLCRHDRIFKLFRRLLNNKVWLLKSRRLRRWLWRRYWAKNRLADAHHGRHMVVVLEKPADACPATFSRF